MCHFVEENIGFNLEIAFIEYFLCKTVFYTKTNTIYYSWNSLNWGYFTILPRIKGVDVLDKLILHRIPMYSVNQYPSIWYVMTPFHDGKNHITHVPEFRHTTLIKQMLNKFSFGESKKVVIY